MRESLVIAYKVIQEIRKSYTTLILFAFVIGLLLLFPFFLKSDGSLKGQTQIVLSYSLTLISIVLYMISIFLSASSFSSELKYKQFYLIDCKPIARSQFFLGKFIGVLMVNALFLCISGIVVFIVLLYLRHYGGTKQERVAISQQVFTVYRGQAPYDDRRKLRAIANVEYRKLREERRLPDNIGEEQIKQEIEKKIRQKLHLIPYGYKRIWYFRDIPVALEKSKKQLKLRYKFFALEEVPGQTYQAKWQIGRAGRQFSFEQKIKAGEFFEFFVPSWVVDANGRVKVSFLHHDKKAGMIYFPLEHGVEMFYPTSSFSVNLIKILFLIYLLSCFFTMLSLFACTFVTFHIALFFGFSNLFLSSVTKFLLALTPVGPSMGTAGLQSLFQLLSDALLRVSHFVLPDFSYYVPIKNLFLGRVIEWGLVLESLFKLLCIRVTLLAIFGCLIFNHKEVGKPLQ